MHRRRGFVFGSLVVVGVALVVLQMAIERETVGAIDVANPGGGAGDALVLYHPGLSDLQEALTDAFVAGLVERDWRVTRTTTSASAPTDLSGYDLLALGVHTYWWAPDGPTRRYLARARDLGGTPVAVLPFFVLRPNDETDPRPNRVVALDRAGELAAAVAVALR